MKTLILKKTFAVFEALTRARDPLSLKEICAQTGITPPAASRLLADLVEAGYVHKVSYRTFEPGLGMIELGQSSLRHNFFPQNAILRLHSELQLMGCGGALAGMFNDRLVYLYHSFFEKEHRISSLPLPEQALSHSNIALVILSVHYGAEKARDMLLADADAHFTGTARERRRNSILRRIEEFQRDRHAVWLDDSGHWNLCFPLMDGAQVYGLSFLGDGDRIAPELFLRCSALAADMRGILAKQS